VQRLTALAAALASSLGAAIGLSGLVSSCSDATGATPGGDVVDAGADASLVDATMSAPDAPPAVPEAATDAADASPEAGDAGDAGDGAPADGGEEASDAGCTVGDAGEALELRCTGLYADWATKTVATDAFQYDPGLHLWSDGASKTRWIHLPSNPADGGVQAIDTSNVDEWTFPVGTKFWKEFVLGGKRVETRLLWKRGPADWYRTTYRWSDDETTAAELTTGELDADGNGYEVPAQAACLQCHQGRVDDVLGFEAVSLASDGAAPFTVQSLAAKGWINDPPDASLAIPGDAVDVAALGYLHANCGTTCHNANGAARATGFFMRLDVATLAGVTSTHAYVTGVNKPSTLAQLGNPGPQFILAPGDVDASYVALRIATRTGVAEAGIGIQMPPIDTHKVDEAGVATVDQWIAQGCQ
jgi:hypothetical protein